MKLILLISIVLLFSCSPYLNKKEFIYTSTIPVVTYTSTDTVCTKEPIKLHYKSNVLDTHVFIEYISSIDTVNTELFLDYDGVHIGRDNNGEILIVQFANYWERKEGLILALYFNTKSVIIGEQCPIKNKTTN